ncbi:MAG: DMT family transporter [Lachnospiraceae bacterium]
MNQNKPILTKPAFIIFFALLCNGLWGSAFPAIKIGYELFDIPSSSSNSQILFAGCRFALAGILTIILGSMGQRKLLLPKKESYKRITCLSLFQTILQYICFYIGLAHTSGVKASILEGVNVFVAIFIAAFIFHHETITWKKILGSALGFLAIILININGSTMEFSFHINGELMIILSTVAYGVSSSLIKTYGTKDNTVMLSGYQFFFGGIVMCIIGLLTGGQIETITVKGLLLLLYLALVSAVAYSVWALLLKYNPVSKITVFGFTNPIFGAILSALLLKEAGQTFGIKEIIALILVSVGIIIVQNQKMRT